MSLLIATKCSHKHCLKFIALDLQEDLGFDCTIVLRSQAFMLNSYRLVLHCAGLPVGLSSAVALRIKGGGAKCIHSFMMNC